MSSTTHFFTDAFGEPQAWNIAGSNSQEVSLQALAAEVATGGYPGREEIDVAFGRLLERERRRTIRGGTRVMAGMPAE